MKKIDNINETNNFINDMEILLKNKIKDKINPKIIIYGGFGKYNTGDDALFLVTMEIILKMFPSANIIASGHNPGNLLEIYKGQVKNCTPVKSKSLHMIKAVFTSDAFILAGGGLSNNLYHKPGSISNLFELRGKICHIFMIIFNILKKPTIVFLSGYHTVPDFFTKCIIKLALKHCSLLGVRCKYSAEILNKMKINNYRIGHDPALLYKAHKEIPLNELKEKYNIKQDKYILFNFRSIINKDLTEKAVKHIIEYINYLKTNYSDMDIILFPISTEENFKEENDLVILNLLYNEINKNNDSNNFIIINNYLKADEIKNLAKQASFLVLTRHHAIVLTCEYNIPTIILSYNIKCRGFAEIAGYEYIIDYENISSNELIQYTEILLNKKMHT